MTNANRPTGLKLIGHTNGAPFNARVTKYWVPASYATALFIGDPVIKTSTSNTGIVITGSNSYAAGTLPGVVKATAGATNRLTGVVIGVDINVNESALSYRPASIEAVVSVCDDPDAIFEIQADGVIAATDMGTNANLIYTNLGSTYTGNSGAELNTATKANDATFQLTALGLIDRVDNELGANAKLKVRINLHTEVNGVVGI